MEIGTLDQNDIKLISDLQPTDWQNIIPTIEFYTNTDFCFPIKVIIEEKIVGIGTTIIHDDIAWLAHIIVHPDHRNQGIGSVITQTLVGNLKTRNCETIYLIATELGEPVYKKNGFETETEYLFFKDIKINGSWKTPKNLVAFKDCFKVEIANLDLQVSGENRLFHLEKQLPSGHVYLQNNVVEGFYLSTWRGFNNCKNNVSRSGANEISIGHKRKRSFCYRQFYCKRVFAPK